MLGFAASQIPLAVRDEGCILVQRPFRLNSDGRGSR